MALLTQDSLYEFLRSQLGVDTSAIEPETSLFESGLVDSFSMVELIAFVESTCGIRFKAKQVKLDNLDSVKRILEFMERVAAGD